METLPTLAITSSIESNGVCTGCRYLFIMREKSPQILILPLLFNALAVGLAQSLEKTLVIVPVSNNRWSSTSGPQKSTDTTTNQCYALVTYHMAARTRDAINPSALDVQLSDTPNLTANKKSNALAIKKITTLETDDAMNTIPTVYQQNSNRPKNRRTSSNNISKRNVS